MTNQCDICGKPATQWMGDPWGKSDVKRPKCAEHGIRLRDPADVAEIERLNGERAQDQHRLFHYEGAIADQRKEIERLREVLTIPNITPETTSSALFIRTLTEHEKGQPVNGQDLINALMWRVKNQRKEIARLHEKHAAEPGVQHRIYTHVKTGNQYEVLHDAMETTNGSREGHGMVVYRRIGQSAVYVREASEFHEKFVSSGAPAPREASSKCGCGNPDCNGSGVSVRTGASA